jgi:1-deoxy-D-xylulose-5-phosphate reductoisomerase
VQAFRDRRLRFPAIVDTVAAVLDAHRVTRGDVGSTPTDLTLDDVLAADAWARDETARLLETAR